jgi:hypothetical protein
MVATAHLSGFTVAQQISLAGDHRKVGFNHKSHEAHKDIP